MKVTAITREALRCRRIRRALKRSGFEEVTEGGGMLWELHRGWRFNHAITGVQIAPEGKTLFVKIEPRA